MSNETAWDHDAVVGAANTARDGLPTISNVANDGGGISPLISGAANEGNNRTTDELGKARGDADKTEKASKNLNDSDIEGGKSLEDVDTELSSDHAGGAKPSLASLGSPTGGGGSPAGGAPMAAPAAPTPPQMPPMQMPQTPQTGNFSMPASMMSNLMKNFDPDKAAAANKDTAMAANGIKEGKISPSDVKFDKTHMGALSKSKLHAVIDRALDLNGIPKDPKVRAQWHEVMTFMAKHESSYNPDAVNVSDSNAHGARAADGNPFNCSRGIWQTIPTTFAAHHVPGTSANIYDPLSSAAASIRYSMSRYGINPDGGASLQRFYADRMRGGYTGY